MSRARSLSLLPRDSAGHHLPVADPQSETHSLPRGAAFLLGRVLN